MWDLIVSVPDHCLSFYIVMKELTKDQEKNANFEARLSRLIAGSGKNDII